MCVCVNTLVSSETVATYINNFCQLPISFSYQVVHSPARLGSRPGKQADTVQAARLHGDGRPSSGGSLRGTDHADHGLPSRTGERHCNSAESGRCPQNRRGNSAKNARQQTGTFALLFISVNFVSRCLRLHYLDNCMRNLAKNLWLEPGIRSDVIYVE